MRVQPLAAGPLCRAPRARQRGAAPAPPFLERNAPASVPYAGARARRRLSSSSVFTRCPCLCLGVARSGRCPSIMQQECDENGLYTVDIPLARVLGAVRRDEMTEKEAKASFSSRRTSLRPYYSPYLHQREPLHVNSVEELEGKTVCAFYWETAGGMMGGLSGEEDRGDVHHLCGGGKLIVFESGAALLTLPCLGRGVVVRVEVDVSLTMRNVPAPPPRRAST